MNAYGMEASEVFQFTPPRGRRRAVVALALSYKGFNSRLRVGGDRYHNQRSYSLHVSIHASAWEATRRGEEYRGR